MKLTILVTALAVAGLPLAATAADAGRDAILADYAAQARSADASFAGFSASRGETLFTTKWGGGDARTSSCTACHTDDPRKPGQNAKTGRPIEPVAPSVVVTRFTDRATVEKQFGRDCKSVLGRDCTPLEKGDYVTFMVGK